MPGKKLNVKCYLEGVEVPLNGVQINIATNQASSATVSIPPTNTAFTIRPRTHVHLFWYDDTNNTWYLLWEGEVLGVGFSKDVNSRSVQLNCLDLSNYWDYITKSLFIKTLGSSYYPNYILFYGDKSAMVTNTPAAALDTIIEAFTKGEDLPSAIYEFLQKLTDKVPFFTKINTQTKLNEMLKIMPDKKTQQLMKIENVRYLSENIAGGQGFEATIRQIIAGFCAMVGYTLSPLGSPSYAGGLNAFILKPNLYGCLPPRCNVIFPDTCSSLQYGRSFMDEPTRSMIIGHVTGAKDEKPSAHMVTSPESLAEQIVKITKDKPSMEDVIANLFTDEEQEKGIVPMTTQIPFAELYAMKGLKKADPKLQKYIQQYGDYAFQMSKYAPRTLSFSTELNPWIVCDFPCVVFNSARSFVANVNQISHSIGADGGGMTQVQCGLARELDKDNDDTPALAGWLSESYDVDNIRSTYQSLLGCDALGDSDPNTREIEGTTRVNISEVADAVYSQDPQNTKSKYAAAVGANAAYSFADSYRRRALATINDVIRFHDIHADDLTTNLGELPDSFDGPMFNYISESKINPGTIVKGTYKRDIIKQYVSELSQGVDGR